MTKTMASHTGCAGVPAGRRRRRHQKRAGLRPAPNLVLTTYLFLAVLLAPMAPAPAQPDPAATGEREKVLFDCDIGSDIDDAYALALLLASPEIELVGVTVGHARTADRAPLALRMLWETGLEHIPVYVGRETPLVTLRDGKPHEQFSEAPYNRQFHWGRGFDEVQPQVQPAAEFIVETLAAHPGEITLLTVGPVTNRPLS